MLELGEIGVVKLKALAICWVTQSEVKFRNSSQAFHGKIFLTFFYSSLQCLRLGAQKQSQCFIRISPEFYVHICVLFTDRNASSSGQHQSKY